MGSSNIQRTSPAMFSSAHITVSASSMEVPALIFPILTEISHRFKLRLKVIENIERSLCLSFSLSMYLCQITFILSNPSMHSGAYHLL